MNWKLLLGCCCLIMLVPAWLLGQDEAPTQVMAQNRSGDLPFSPSVGSDAEHVDIPGGNLSIRIPILHLPGRGMNYNFDLVYDARFWVAAVRGGSNPFQLWNIEQKGYLPQFNNGLWATNMPRVSYATYTKICNTDDPDALNHQFPGNFLGHGSYMYHDESGAKHPLAGLGSETAECEIGSYDINNVSGPDLSGSGIIAQLDPSGGGYVNAIVLSDGASNFGSALIANEVISADNLTSHLGLISYGDVYGNTKSEWQGGGGVDTLGRVMFTRTDNRNQTVFSVADANGSQRSYTVNYVDQPINTTFNITSLYGYIREYTGTRKAISSVVLPNGLSYQFHYDNFGMITEMDLPTGGVIAYGWATDNGLDAVRYVTSRTITVGGQSSTWNFTRAAGSADECAPYSTGLGCLRITMTDPEQNQTVYIRNITSGSTPNVTRVRIYQGSANGTPLREYTVDYLIDVNDGSAVSLPTAVTTKLETGLVSRKEFTYDAATFNYLQCIADEPFFCTQDNTLVQTQTISTTRGNVLTIKEYDWGQGAPGPLIRTTTNDYLHDPAVNPATAAQYAAQNIVGKIVRQTVTDAGNNVVSKTEYEYDNNTTTGPYLGSATKVKHWRNTDGAMLATTYTYDPFGNITSISDPLNHQTTWSYDDNWANSSCLPSANSHAYVTQVTNAKTQRIQLTRYPCTGQVQAHKDENDIQAGLPGTTYTYDLMNRPLVTSFPDGGQTSFDYHGDVLPLKVTKKTAITSNLNLVTSTLSDGLGRNVQTSVDSDPAGVTFGDTGYDAVGRVATVSNPYRSTSDPTYGITQTQYDVLGRPKQVTKQDGSIATLFYTGNCTTATDEAGKARESCSDALGRLTTVFEDPAGLNYETDYQYDALGNLLRVDQKGSAPNTPSQWRTRLFAYNSLSQLLTATNPESGTISYFYDNVGNLLQKVMPTPNQTGNAQHTLSYCYDELNRVTGVAYSWQNCQGTQLPAGTAQFTYSYDTYAGAAQGSSIGRLVRSGQVGYLGHYFWYDALGRVTSTWQCLPSDCTNGASVSAQYDLAGGLTQLTYPDGETITYTPDSSGAMVSAVDSGNNINYITGATYAPGGALSGFVSGNSGPFAGITNGFVYNNRLQPCRTTASSTGQLPTTCTSLWGNLLDLEYRYNLGAGDNGNVTQIVNWRDQSRTQTFTYDQLNRLTSAQNAGTDCSATPKPLNPNQTKYWGNGYGYDAWGNLLSKTVTKCNAEQLSVTANNNNQLVGDSYDAAGNMTWDPTDGVTAAYDAENRIATATKNGITAAYTYDADGERLRKDSAGSPSTEYLYFNGQIFAEKNVTTGAWTNYVFFDGERVARRDGVNGTGGVFYYFSDHLKTTDIVTDASGNILNESDFYPWGGELQFLANDSNHYKLTGKERDTETNLDYFGARYYSNGLGRFITPDWAAKATAVPYAEFSDPQTLNLYGYVRGLPTTRYDADGHCCWDQIKGIAIGIFNQTPPGYAVHSIRMGYQEYKQPGATLANAKAQVKSLAVSSAANGGTILPGNPAAEKMVANTFNSMSTTEKWTARTDTVLGLFGMAAGTGISGPAAAGTDARLTGTALAQSLGQAGEDAVGITGPKTGIQIPGSGITRFPDQLSSTTLTEVKNVQYQSFTQQLRDYSAFAQQNDLSFDLFVRPSTRLSGPLSNAVASGDVNLRFIPGTQ